MKKGYSTGSNTFYYSKKGYSTPFVIPLQPEVEAMIDAFDVVPDSNTINALNAFVYYDKADGNWDKRLGFYVLGLNTQHNSLLNLKNPGTFDLTINGTVNWVVNEGFTTDGIDGSFLNPSFIPSINGGSVMDADNLYFSFYLRDTNVSDTYEIGVSAAGSSCQYVMSTNNSLLLNANVLYAFGGDLGISYADNFGTNLNLYRHFQMTFDGTTGRFYNQGVLLDSNTPPPAIHEPMDCDLIFLAYNASGTPGFPDGLLPSARQAALWSFGGSLNPATAYTRENNLLAALNLTV